MDRSEWVLIEQCTACHGSGYVNRISGPMTCWSCDGNGTRSPPPPAEQASGELPALPDGDLYCHGATTVYGGEYFTAEQMRAYARAAINAALEQTP